MSATRHVGTPDWLTMEPDERVWFRARPSKNVLLGTFVVGTLLLLAIGALALTFDVAIPTARLLSGGVLLFVFGLTGVVFLSTRRVEYALSTHRAYRAVGFTSPDVESVPLSAVTGVRVERSTLERRLGVGEVHLDGADGTLLSLRYVEHPEWVGERIRERVE